MISGQVHNIKALQQAHDEMENLNGSRQAYIVQYAIALRQFIQTGLVQLLQDRARHFDIIIEEEDLKLSVKIKANSDTGRYIYYGTQPHNIDSRLGSPLSMGGNRFMSASHPGTKGMKDKIDAAVRDAVGMTEATLGSLGMRR